MRREDKNNRTFRKRSVLSQNKAGKIDNFLIKLAMFFTVILFLSQGLLFKAETRQFFSMVDRLEGEQILSSANLSAGYEPKPANNLINNNALTQMSKMAGKTLTSLRPGQTLVIRIIEPRKSDKAFVLVNGKPQGDLSRGSLAVVVYDGDYLEIDSTGLNEPSQFVVNSLNQEKVLSPPDGMFIKGNQALLTVGKVKLK